MGASTLLDPNDIINFNKRVDERIDQRLNQRDRMEQQRRDAWKRRARQHHIDQAGCCTGESKCPCPNCHEYREFYRNQEGVVRHILARTVGVTPIRDEVIIHETNPGSGEWIKGIVDAGAYMSREQATEFYRKHGAETPWSDPPLKLQHAVYNQAKEIRAMSPLQMFLLYSLLARPRAALLGCIGGEIQDATTGLLQAEMIERTDKSGSGYQLSARAMVFLNAIDKTPLPVRKPAPWVMPN